MPNICSGYLFKLEGTCTNGWVGILSPGIPITIGIGAVFVESSPLILAILKHLRVVSPLGVVGVGAEPVPYVCAGHWPRLEAILFAVFTI